MTATTADERTVRSHGWSPELLTVLGAVLMIGVGLAGLMLNMQGQIREDMRSLETRLRADMELMEGRLRADMELMEGRLRADMELMEGRLREVGWRSACAKTCARFAVMSASSARECRTLKDGSI